jgi:hypothetical protein
VIGNSAAPYINNTLLPMGSLLTNYHANTHNSDPNYEAIAFGNSYGRSANSTPGSNCITSAACAATNNGLGDNLDAVGKSWKQYVQSQTSNCQTTSSGNYENDDAPFYYAPRMKSDNAYCQAHWQPLPQLLNTDLASTASTPAFVWADADSCYDMEGCGIASGDTWLSQTLPTLFGSPAWTQQKSLLVVSWDEDGANSPGGFGPGQTNQVATIVVGSQGTVKAGYQDANRYGHYSTARVIDSALGLPAMTDNDKWATPFNEVFTNSGAGSQYSVPIVNPAAETGACASTVSTGTPVQGWTLTNSPQQVCYGASGGFPTSAQGPTAPADPGNAFFDGGSTATASMTQTVGVSDQAARIAAGDLPYTLSAWVGGYASQGDNAGLVATFLSSSGASLGTATLAPVTAAQRGNTTGLLHETASGTVPTGTASVRFTGSFTRTAGTGDDGYLDDIAMTFDD